MNKQLNIGCFQENIFSKIIVAIPMTIWLIIYRIYPKDFGIDNTSIRMVYMFGGACLIGSISSFILNFLKPYVLDKKRALQVALTIFISYILFAIANYFLTSYFWRDLSLESLWFNTLGLCFFHIPIGVMLAAALAFFGWVGAWLRTQKLGSL